MVDFIEAFAKANVANNLVLKSILPLVNLAALSSKEEADLAQKSTKVLKSVFSGRLEDPIAQLDVPLATTTLKSVHEACKKVHKVDIGGTFNPCCRFLVKNLNHAKEVGVVQAIYRTAFDDYFTAKQSRMQIPILKDFVESTPSCAWGLRERIAELSKTGGSVNTFHQLQAVQILKDLVRSASQPNVCL